MTQTTPATPESADPSFPDTSAQVWHTTSTDASLGALESTADGLSQEEAARRIAHFGPNQIEMERETPIWLVLLHQFTDPLIYILLLAAAVTLAFGHYTDTGVILAVVLLNALIGFTQETRAKQAIRGLARLTAPKAEVIRNGSPRELPSSDLVPGDIVFLASGGRVPADLRLLQTRDLAVDESALTGESAPVRKSSDALEERNLVPGDQINMAFAGTIVTRGRGRAVVVRTGAATELGRIATAMREVGITATPLQTKVERLSKWIGLAILLLASAVTGIGIALGMPVAEIMMAAVAMAVATIPEGLPIVLTVTLAVGVRRMAKRNAIVRKLPAVETLGSTTVIGSDKTGTLTRNEMTVRALWVDGRDYEVTGVGYEPRGELLVEGRAAIPDDEPPDFRLTLLGASLASEADPGFVHGEPPRGDPTELALHTAAAKAGLDPVALRKTHSELDILPFEPERQMMATLNEGPEGRSLYVKGAPEAVLKRCSASAEGGAREALDPDTVRRAAAELASRGLRVLAVAYRRTDRDRIEPDELETGLRFAGLLGMEDPVRPEAVEAVHAARQAGIRVLMFTGDHVGTARAIGRQLGMGGTDAKALEGHEVEPLDDDQLDAAVHEVDIYARVAPEHKLRLTQRLKHQGHIVAVTGDGVNDAPALRAAHLGIAMGATGTDVAREASDMVLADDNFASITAAIEEGRIVFANIRKVTFFLLSTGVGMPLTILASLFVGWPLPFLAAQILWINLVTNGLQDVALAFEPGEPGLLKQKPRPTTEGVITPRVLRRLGAVGLVLAAGTMLMFWYALERTGDLDYARSIAMTQMVVFQFFHVFNSRSLDRSILSIPPFSNRFLFVSILAAAMAHFAVLHFGPLQAVFRTVPLSLSDWGIIILVGIPVILGGELDKWWNRRRTRPLG